MVDAFIGLDLGTTSIKAVAFDRDDGELARATLPTPTHPVDDGAEYDADELWTTAASALRELTTELAAGGHHAVAIAVASMAEAGVLLDVDGRPTGPVIAWFDQRTEPQAAWWREHVGAQRTIGIAGVPPRPVLGAAKMLWTSEHRPDAWAAGQRWLNMADWAAFRLCGEMATDQSLASRTMLLDVAAGEWSDELIDAAGLDRSMLAPLVASGTRLGVVHDEAARATGLPVGCVVGVGGQDHVCAALGLGVTEPGMLLDSIGTAEAFFLVTDGFDPTGTFATAAIGQGLHVEPGRTYAMTGLQQGGGRIDTRRRELGLAWDAFFETAEAETVIEEVAAAGQARIADMLGAAGITEIRHVVTGGGSANDRLLEHKRRIGGRPIEVAAESQATALGAAHLARRALNAS